MTSFSPLPPQAFPLQVVDRALFTGTQVFLAVFSDAATAQEIAVRLNAGEMWRLGLEPPASAEPDPVGEDEDESGGWTLTGPTIQSNSLKP